MKEMKFFNIKRKQTEVSLAPVTYREIKEILSDDSNFGISVSEADVNNLRKGFDNDFIVGYIARNPENESDKWFVWYEFAEANYELEEKTKDLTFSEALDYIKQGKRVARRGWNGRNMFIFLVPGSTFKVNRPPLLGIYEEGTEVSYHAHIDMKTAQGDIVPWLASQTDLLAEDWEVVEK